MNLPSLDTVVDSFRHPPTVTQLRSAVEVAYGDYSITVYPIGGNVAMVNVSDHHHPLMGRLVNIIEEQEGSPSYAESE